MNRAVQQFRQFLQRIQFLPRFPQGLALNIPQKIADPGNLLQACAQSQTVPGIQVPVSHLVHQALHVIDAAEFLLQRHACHPVAGQLSDGIQPFIDLPDIQQRLFDPAAQETSAHCGRCSVDQVQEGSFFSASQTFRQFQVPSGVLIQQHGPSVFSKANVPDMLQGILLGFVQVFDQRASGAGCLFPVIQSDGCQIGQSEVAAQGFLGVVRLEPVAWLPADIRAFRAEKALKGIRIVADDLHRMDPADLGPQQVHLRLHHVKLAGGYIRIGETGLFPVDADAHQEIVGFVFQHGRIRDRSRRDHPDHIPFHESFCRRRIFHLLADGNLVSFGDQFFDVCVHGMIRDAAHRCPLFQSAVLSGQGQFQFPGSRFGILKEQLIEVTQPEQQQAVVILLMDPQILLHHR